MNRTSARPAPDYQTALEGGAAGTVVVTALTLAAFQELRMGLAAIGIGVVMTALAVAYEYHVARTERESE